LSPTKSERTATQARASVDSISLRDLPGVPPPPPPDLVLPPAPVLASNATSAASSGPSSARIGAEPAVLPFDAAVTESLDEVLGHLPSLPALLGGLAGKGGAGDRIGVVLLPVVHGRSGRQSLATSRAERIVAERIGERFKRVDLLPFTADGLAGARYVVAVNLARSSAEPGDVPFRVAFALIDVGSSRVASSASAMARIDIAGALQPLPFDRDRPIGFRDSFVDGVVRATSPAAVVEPGFMARLPSTAPTFEAIRLYDLGRYEDALAGFRFAMATPPGDLRLLSLLYLANWRLGRDVEAEQMFARIVQTGLATRQWALMLQDGQITPRQLAAEQMWLSQVATQTAAAHACLAVIGHIDRQPSREAEQRLSLARASVVRTRLVELAPELATRAIARAAGSREPVVGSGTHDDADAPDRRIDFRVLRCS
jgi:flagellar motor protein MotB